MLAVFLRTLIFLVAVPCATAQPDAAADLRRLYRDASAAVNAGRRDQGLELLGELVRRVEALRAELPEPERRRMMFAAWVGRYREYAALLALAGRHDEAFRIAELTKARTLLELSMARRGPAASPVPTAERVRSTSVSLAEARALLPAGTAYLSYLVQDNVLMLLLLTPERGLLLRLPPPIPRLSHTMAAFQFLLTLSPEDRVANKDIPSVWRRRDGSFELAENAPEAEAIAVSEPQEIADALGEKLLGFVAAELKGSRRILISPDGNLAMLPFEVLRTGGRYLIEQHEVQYTQSMAMYALSRARAAEYALQPGRLDLLAVGGAIYEEYVKISPLLAVHAGLLLPPVDGQPALTGGAPAAAQSLKPSSVLRWVNLPASEIEVDEVARLFEPRGRRVLKGGEATEERLWRLNASGELARYRYLLFATHGYASSLDPDRNSVVLTQVGNRNGFDGYVTAAEWPQYELRADLAVVSACSTGLGYIIQGEGLMGLPFALHLAGTRSSLLTLWTVRDLATADFVVQFFHHLRGGADQASALALAKRSFLADPRRSHPHLWAPFVLYGS